MRTALCMILLAAFAALGSWCVVSCEHACCHKCGNAQPLVAAAAPGLPALLPELRFAAPVAPLLPEPLDRVPMALAPLHYSAECNISPPLAPLRI